MAVALPILLAAIFSVAFGVVCIYKYDHFLSRDEALNARILSVEYITRATDAQPDSEAHRAIKLVEFASSVIWIYPNNKRAFILERYTDHNNVPMFFLFQFSIQI